MAKKRSTKKPIEQYDHKGKKRVNNPPVGLVTPETDPDIDSRGISRNAQYAYDPHIDPSLQWAGKAEHTSFEVPTVSLHVHERIDPRVIIESVRKKKGPRQMSLFERPDENLPLREAIDFYKHPHGWSNRLIAGDSLLVMNSLLEKEGMAGKVQMIYVDPPYGIKYGSNFQPFVNKRDVKDGKDEDLTQEPEMIKAFRDTWELGIHSYLAYLRDRLLLAKELLTESGSVFVQISDENVHHVKELLDELFGTNNFVSIITFKKTTGLTAKLLTQVSDFIVWFAKDLSQIKYRQLYLPKILGGEGATHYNKVKLKDGNTRTLTKEEISNPSILPKGAKIYEASPMISQGNPLFTYEYQGKQFPGTYKTTKRGIDNLAAANRLEIMGNLLRYRRFFDDYPVYPITNIWEDILGIQSRTDVLAQ
ncbi:MAG: DNA methyltransferase [Candidatus Scalinduaceae bacterium]